MISFIEYMKDSNNQVEVYEMFFDIELSVEEKIKIANLDLNIVSGNKMGPYLINNTD